MSYLIDTNIISEVRKGERCDVNVARWYRSIQDGDLYLSVLVLGEIRKGIESLRPRDRQRAEALDDWLAEVVAAFGDRVLPVDGAVTYAWGRIAAMRPIPVIDGLLAATALVHGLTFVTRDEADVAGLGASMLNPFKG